MGREYRSIAVTAEEFDQAVRDYLAARKERAVHAANIANMTLEQGDDPNRILCRVVLSEPLLDGVQEIALNAEELVEVLVRFCRSKAVPLPKSSLKTIGRVNGDLALMIELDFF